MKPYVSPFPAAEFVCDKCGRNSFFSLIGVEHSLDEDELEDFYEKSMGKDLPENTKGFWYMYPKEVKCQHCNTEYLTFQQEMEKGKDEG
jgi:protein-arginine kinase activator protein McsA